MKGMSREFGAPRRHWGAAGCLVLLLFAAAPVCAQMRPIEKKENPFLTAKAQEGRDALENQEFDRALSAFQNVLALALQDHDLKWQADSYFYLGLTRQQQAEKLGNAPGAQAAIAESEEFYKQALALKPNSPSILNNLAQLYASSGREKEAQELLRKSVSLKDQHSGVSAQNYAALLDRTGDVKSASQYYAMVAASQPDNVDAHERAVAAFIQADPKGLGAYLWNALKSGQVLRVQESAIAALQRREWEPEPRRELLALVAASLSQQSYDPAKYKDTFAAENLATFAGDSVIGGGVVELMRLHGAGAVDPSAYRWWSEAGDLHTDPPRGQWPRDAFRGLIRSLGNWYQRRGDLQRAESFYRLAVKLNRSEIDPVACLALADLYISQNRASDVDHLMNELAPELFYGKGEAYRSSQWQKIYEFHRALGLIYSYMKRWGNSGAPSSAIFQLEHAMEAAARLNMRPEPRLVDSLAAAYENSGQFERGSSLRLRYAEEFIQQKDYLNAQELLAPLTKQKAVGKLGAADIQRYERALRLIPPPQKK
jgi:Flp pilus assembly protein TadD